MISPTSNYKIFKFTTERLCAFFLARFDYMNDEIIAFGVKKHTIFKAFFTTISAIC